MPIAGIVLAVLYGGAARRLRLRARVRWPAVRVVPFAAGCAVLVAAAFVSDSFAGHMTEHVLIGMVAPLLLALGAPVTLILQAGDGAWLRRLLHTRAVRAATHPLVVLVVFAGSLVALVFSPLLEWSVRNDAVHALVHAHFFVAGFLFAATMVAVDPIPRPLPHGARLLAVLALVPFHAFVGVAVMTARSPLYPLTYPSLDDQRAAAAVLWSSGELLTLAVAAVVFSRWWAHDKREAARLDRRLAAARLSRSDGPEPFDRKTRVDRDSLGPGQDPQMQVAAVRSPPSQGEP